MKKKQALRARLKRIDQAIKDPNAVKRAMKDPEFIFVDHMGGWARDFRGIEQEPAKAGFTLRWMAKGIGFGQITFRKRGVGKKAVFECETEMMGRAFLEKALAHLAKTVKIIE